MIRADEHYRVQHDPYGAVRVLACTRCNYALVKRDWFRQGDRSGMGAYNRARAAMMRHWRDEHPNQRIGILAPRREGDAAQPGAPKPALMRTWRRS